MNFHLKFFVSKFEGWKGRHFYGRPRAALSLATPPVPCYCGVCLNLARCMWG